MCFGSSGPREQTPPPPQPATMFEYGAQRSDGRSTQQQVVAANTTVGKGMPEAADAGQSFGASLGAK